MAKKARITHKRVGELLRTVFEILREHPDGLQAKEVLAKVPEKVTLDEYELGNFPSQPLAKRYEQIIRFATIDAVKAGWLTKVKGTWALTDTGIQAFEDIRDPAEFARQLNRIYRAWRQEQPDVEDLQTSVEEGALSEVNERGDAVTTLEEAEELGWTEISEHLHAMHPYDFQKLVGALLRAMGYHVVWEAPPGKDGGIDILAFPDPLGTRPPRIKVQVKRSKNKTDVGGLRSFLAILGDEDAGIFVNIGGFTADAEAEARAQQNRKITLLALDQLFDLWVEHYEKLNEADRAYLPLQPVYFLSPAR